MRYYMNSVFIEAMKGNKIPILEYLISGGNPYETIDGVWAETIAYVAYSHGHSQIVKCITNHLNSIGQDPTRAMTDVLLSSYLSDDFSMLKFLHENGVSFEFLYNHSYFSDWQKRTTKVTEYIRIISSNQT